jgi:hypothetical protein
MHARPGGHACPQVPQFDGSWAVSTQAPLQFVVPAGQIGTHWPAWQAMPGAQLWPHAPQFWASAVKSTQPPVQAVRPVGH